MMQSHIRNFCVIAHIDHGKSTLADRLLEFTGTVQMRDMQAQILDSNPIERERGITIKLAPVRMVYQVSGIKYQDSKRMTHDTLTHDTFVMNLIDTPGHVDFGYEVSRSLAACEGALLVVDATQGVQAQTLANLAAARTHNLTIIPLVNKIDMPHARIEETRAELRALGFRDEEMIEISAKTGQNVETVLEAIVRRIPPPSGEPAEPLRALVFSSQYDTHKGVVAFIRIVDGSTGRDSGNLEPDSRNQTIKTYQKLRFLASGAEVAPIEVGYFSPHHGDQTGFNPCSGLATGEVGYIATGLKDARLARVGDTITRIENRESRIEKRTTILDTRNSKPKPLPGYKEPKPMVFLSLFPLASDEFTRAREAMEKLRLSDSAFTFRPISSAALGNGFHCGFLGLLHAEIVQERLSREFDLNIIATAPSVEYHLVLNSGVSLSKLGLTASSVIGEPGEQGIEVMIQSATEFPDPTYIAGVKEPIMEVKIFTPKRYIGAVMQLAVEKRGEYIDLKYIGGGGGQAEPGTGRYLAEFTYLIPLADMIIDFFDRLKSVSEGYASLDYEFFEFQAVDVVKIDILVNKEKVDALSFLAVRDQARHRSSAIVERLAQVIPRQQFSIPIQAAIGSPRFSSGGAGGEIIARDDVKAFRKDVTQKLYGGDRTRKDKLLDKQKKGKARMKKVGSVEIPQNAFFAVLKQT